MNKILFITFLILPIALYAGDNKKGGTKKDDKKQKLIPVSRWREIKRMKPDSTVVNFTDTLYISFERKDSFSYHHRNGFVYDGIYKISEDSILDFGTDRFKVLERIGNNLVMFNANGIFQFAADSSDTTKVIVLEKADSTVPVTNIDQMIGHWTVYKRTSEGPTVIDMDRNIRSVFVTGPASDGKLGQVYGGTDADNNPSWFIKSLTASQSLDCEGKSPRTLKVVRCQKGEMILEEDGIRYYFKQLR
jgi:hypothetical protein